MNAPLPLADFLACEPGERALSRHPPAARQPEHRGDRARMVRPDAHMQREIRP